MNADVTASHSSGLSAVPSATQPCVSKRDGPPAVREPRRMQTRRDSFGRAWILKVGRSGWMGQTCDARKEIAFFSHQGGARRAHVEGEWLGRMFRAGRHARYVPWSPEVRGPGSGAPHLAGAPSLRHRNLKVWKKGRVVAHHWSKASGKRGLKKSAQCGLANCWRTGNYVVHRPAVTQLVEHPGRRLTFPTELQQLAVDGKRPGTIA